MGVGAGSSVYSAGRYNISDVIHVSELIPPTIPSIDGVQVIVTWKKI